MQRIAGNRFFNRPSASNRGGVTDFMLQRFSSNRIRIRDRLPTFGGINNEVNLIVNNQINNMNINTRFQWRFAPVSDFFLVYTDNYTSDAFNIKDRSIVAKLTYWLNL